MLLRDLRLDLSNVVPDPSKQTVQVVSASSLTDKEGKIIGYRLEIATRRASRNTVKLEDTAKNKELVEQLNKMLRTQDMVEVYLTNPYVSAYAMISKDNLVSGVSIKADSFAIAFDDEII